MKDIIVYIVLAVITYLLSHLFKNFAKDDFKNEEIANGVITGVVYYEGTTKYLVKVKTKEGVILDGKSITYSRVKRIYKEGDQVQMKYFVNKSGRVFVSILDDGLIPSGNSFKTLAKIMRIVSMVFVILSVILIMRIIM